MDFSTSTFVVEINRTPAIVFQAKWAADAERIAFGWAERHSDRIKARGSHGTELPPTIKVRVARQDEKAAANQAVNAEIYEGVEIVYLVELGSL
jgi:hypothetical protein